MRLSLLALAVFGPALATTSAQESAIDLDELLERIEANEREQAELRALLEAERARREEEAALHAAETEVILDEIEELRGIGSASTGPGVGATGLGGRGRWFERFTLGGYGETHFTFKEGEGGDVADIHRFVMYVGYRFADWITLNSETEIEHGLVLDDNGEVSIEQLFLDFMTHEHINVRAGRVLAPLGIVNEYHEPPLFNGVERPNFDRVIIPTTWPLDGVGVFGNICDNAQYKLYVTGGLDGSKFSDTGGIRGGRLKERPSLNDPAISGRVDWNPFVNSERNSVRDLRLGFSFFHGGIDNGNNGADPDLDGDVSILSADFSHRVGDFDFRGVWAHGEIDGASGLNEALADEDGDPGIGSEFGGWYLEAAYHVMPDDWKDGKLAQSDVVAFARYEDYDTQKNLPDNATPNGAADRTDLTVGFSVFLTPQLVVKIDYQFLDDDASGDRPEQLNLGFGFNY